RHEPTVCLCLGRIFWFHLCNTNFFLLFLLWWRLCCIISILFFFIVLLLIYHMLLIVFIHLNNSSHSNRSYIFICFTNNENICINYLNYFIDWCWKVWIRIK